MSSSERTVRLMRQHFIQSPNKYEKKDEGIRFNPDSNVDYQPLSKEEQSEIDAEIEKVMRDYYL